VTEGRRACGEVFTAFAERIASPGFPYRVAGPFWDGFIARLALAVLRPEAGPGPAPVPPAPPRAGELAGELRVMGAEEAAGGFGAQYSDIDKVTAHHGDNHVPLVARHFRK
jgi:hypothetical protein